MAITKRKVGKTEVDWDEELGGPVFTTPEQEEPPAPKQSGEDEAPVVEAPVAEAPVVEAPVVEAPVAEAPVVEAPVAEAPV